MSGWKNKLYYGDNLDVMRKHIKDESVDLVYIDPPFNSKRNYNQIYNNIGGEDMAQAQAFTDTWIWDDMASDGLQQILSNREGRFTSQSIELIKGLHKVLKEGSLLAYLISMTLRITEIHRVLTSTGSFYLHCDPTASHYLKLVLDSVMVPQGGDYKNEISWQRTNAHNTAGQYGRIHDVIFFYTKSNNYTWNALRTSFGQAQLSRYKKDENGRLYTGQDLTASRPDSSSGKFEWRGTMPSASRGWGYELEQLEEWWEQGLILKRKDGTPRMDGLKVYLDEKEGKPLQSMWTDIPRIANTSPERLGYPTQKPEALLDRIISASSNEGDIILDAYCGCGTTIAVAERLKRRWIGMDITYQSISLILRRLEQKHGAAVLDSITLSGVPRDMESAVALAHKKDDRLRKEFEKWAVLTYTNNRAIINDKKGADKGIDGTAYFQTEKTENAKIIFQVKSGGVERGDVAKLRGDMEREQAAIAVFITLEKPKRTMLTEAKAAGQFRHETMGRNYDKIQIVTIAEIVEEGKRLDIPMSLEVLKAAQREVEDKQQPLF